MLRRRGSKIVTLSVYEGRSTVQAQKRLSAELKRRSDDGETLGFALARLKDEKRKAPAMQIGELTFENGAPVRSNTSKPLVPMRNPMRQYTAPTDLSGGSYSKSSIGIARPAKQELSAANMAYASSAITPRTNTGGSGAGSTKAHSASGSISNIGGFPFPPGPATLPPVPAVSLRGFAMPPSNPDSHSLAGNSKLSTVASSNLSIGSASRAHMMGTPASNVSVGSVKSGTPIMKPAGASLRRSPHGTGIKRPTNQPAAKDPSSMPMSMVETNFISMTPARSELSINSARGGEKDQWDQLSVKAASVGTHNYTTAPGGPHNFPTEAGSLPGSQLPSVLPIDLKGKGRMRSATDPLPPLPTEMPFKAVPVNNESRQVDAVDRRPAYMSASKPSASLTIDTRAAEELARQRRQHKEQQMLQQQQEQQQQQQSAPSQPYETRIAT